jgi:pimeloyl-ACP methyl ester carboxylesterase
MSDYPSIYRSKAGYEAVMAMYDEALRRGSVSYQTCVVSTRYGKTQVVIGGPDDAPPLVLFHGWNGNAAGAGAEFPFLFDSFRVYMPDIIGHSGKSDPNRPPVTGSTYADWVVDVLDALKIQTTIVMGISGGGWLTLKCAAHHPARTSRAVALSTDGLSPTNTWGMLRGMVPAALFPNSVTTRWFLNFVTAPTSPQGPQALAFADGMHILLKHFKTQRNPGLLSDDELCQITTPLLVLMGEYERIFSPTIALERARRLIPGLVAAELVLNAGHLMSIDQPEWLSQRILRFLRQ